jgi:type IV pilus assembly protein PilW
MRQLAAQQGMTLIELMVSMVIGLFLIMGAVTVYSQGRQNHQSNEAIARLQENMRFAVDTIEPDIRLAGYWGLNNRGGDVDNGAITVTCGASTVTSWVLNGGALDATNNVQAANKANVFTNCAAFGAGVAIDTDVLTVRHASSTPVALANGSIQVQSSLGASHLVNDGNLHSDHVALAGGETFTHGVSVNTWYVSQDSNNNTGVPSLRRRTLIGTQMIDEEVISGVENFQIQFGLDTDADGGDGSIDRYVDAGHAAVPVNNILAIRFWVLVRSVEEERTFTGGRADNSWAGYAPLDSSLSAIKPTDKFRRVQMSKTVFLRNNQRVQLSGV